MTVVSLDLSAEPYVARKARDVFKSSKKDGSGSEALEDPWNRDQIPAAVSASAPHGS